MKFAAKCLAIVALVGLVVLLCQAYVFSISVDRPGNIHAMWIWVREWFKSF